MTVGVSRSERAAAVLVGAAAGDALGWPQENRSQIAGGNKERESHLPRPRFRSWTRRGGSRFTGYFDDEVRAGDYSDDTQLICASARACLSGESWLDRLVEVELPAWLAYQRGGGAAVLAAARAWSEARPPWTRGKSVKQNDARDRYFGSGANGVAMRVSPHVLYAPHAKETLLERIVLDGIATHGHPRALVGALVFGTALRAAFNSDETLEYGSLVRAGLDGIVDFDDIQPCLPKNWAVSAEIRQIREVWASTNREMVDLLGIVQSSLERGSMSSPDSTLTDLGCSRSEMSGAGTITAAGAIYLASRSAARPMSGLLTATFLNDADTDTLGSMTGSLLGAIHGLEWLGSLRNVQDAPYLDRLGRDLFAPPDRAAPIPSPIGRPSEIGRGIRNGLQQSDVGASGVFVDGRNYRLVGFEDIYTRGKTSWSRLRLEIDDGQTVIIDRQNESPIVRNSMVGVDTVRLDETDIRSVTQVRRSRLSSQFYGRSTGGVSLPSLRFSECVRFYERLAGRKLAVIGDAVEVTEWLVLHNTPNRDQPGRADQSQITIYRSDLSRVAQEFGVEIADAIGGPSIQLRDPDGRYIVIFQSKDQ